MSEEEIKLDRYAKFRKLGDYADYPVVGGLWREAREERKNVSCHCRHGASGHRTFEQNVMAAVVWRAAIYNDKATSSIGQRQTT